jgi:hypothetical protein
MTGFLDLLEQATEDLEDLDEILEDFFFEGLDEEELNQIREEAGLTDEEYEEILEALRKTVSSSGKVRRIQSRNIRKRRATLTTGLSKIRLKLRARKGVRTKRRNPSSMRKAIKRRRRALRIRKQRGIK